MRHLFSGAFLGVLSVEILHPPHEKLWFTAFAFFSFGFLFSLMCLRKRSKKAPETPFVSEKPPTYEDFRKDVLDLIDGNPNDLDAGDLDLKIASWYERVPEKPEPKQEPKPVKPPECLQGSGYPNAAVPVGGGGVGSGSHLFTPGVAGASPLDPFNGSGSSTVGSTNIGGYRDIPYHSFPVRIANDRKPILIENVPTMEFRVGQWLRCKKSIGGCGQPGVLVRVSAVHPHGLDLEGPGHSLAWAIESAHEFLEPARPQEGEWWRWLEGSFLANFQIGSSWMGPNAKCWDGTRYPVDCVISNMLVPVNFGKGNV